MREKTLFFLVALAAASGCSAAPTTREATGSASSSIVGGTPATTYQEAALVDMFQNGQLFAACSGSVIAPQVVLTAGHCVDQVTSWKVTAPYANGQTSTAEQGALFDYKDNADDTVNPNLHDIGLVFLDTPITLSAYPELAQSELASGAQIVNIGRIQNGQLSNADLFVGSPVTANDATSSGFPFDYIATDIIEAGDSGGPDEVPSSPTHLIVSVNSGGGSGTEVLARVDLLYGFIQQQITAHGGGGFPAAVLDGGTPAVEGGGPDNQVDSGSGAGGSGGGGGAASGGGNGGSSGGGAAGGDGNGSGNGDSPSGGAQGSPYFNPSASSPADARSSCSAAPAGTAGGGPPVWLALAVLAMRKRRT
jgi:trypsin